MAAQGAGIMWLRDRHRRYSNNVSVRSSVPDPLGAGNTQLLADLGVAPLAFYDVRKLAATGATGTLPDVSGGSTYGGPLVQATGTKQPVFNGTTLAFDGTDDCLVGSALAALDISQPLTIVFVADWSAIPSGLVPYSIAPVGAAQFHRGLRTGGATIRSDLSDGVTLRFIDSTAPVATGMLLMISTVNVAAASVVTVEVPTKTKVTSAATGTLTSSAGRIVLGCHDAASSFAAVRFRAMLVWPGGYTTAQRDTLKTWATAYHGAVLA